MWQVVHVLWELGHTRCILCNSSVHAQQLPRQPEDSPRPQRPALRSQQRMSAVDQPHHRSQLHNRRCSVPLLSRPSTLTSSSHKNDHNPELQQQQQQQQHAVLCVILFVESML